jgi:hypothetical protein
VRREDGWVLIEGERWDLIPYGSETIDGEATFSRPCRICRAVPGALHDGNCPMGPGQRYAWPALCRDCRVAEGQVHHPNCGIEQCPRCGRQYASCPCDSSEDAPASEGDTSSE